MEVGGGGMSCSGGHGSIPAGSGGTGGCQWCVSTLDTEDPGEKGFFSF